MWRRSVPSIAFIIAVSDLFRPAARVPGATLPPNLTAAAVFRTTLDTMLQSSPTFRRQCRRLSVAPHLQVAFLLEDPARRPSSYYARSVMKRDSNGLLVSVDIHLVRTENSVELMAHEVEHVLEQLDGVDFELHLGTGNVRKREDGAFETPRAIEVGRRVTREVSLAEAAGQRDIPWRNSPPGRLYTFTQQDESPDRNDSPSGRMAAGGRHVVFASYAPLVPADQNRTRDIYVFDAATGRLTLETPAAGGGAANGESVSPDISRDGRYVVFESTAGNVTSNELSRGVPRVFLRDRQMATTVLLSSNATGEPANGPSRNPVISADGRTVAYVSSATNLLSNRIADAAGIGIYVVRAGSPQATRVDITSHGVVRAGQSAFPAINADGRYVAFMSRAALTTRDDSSPDDNGVFDIYVHDTITRRTRRVSHGLSSRDSDGPSYHPAISGDGRFVAFVSEASNLTPEGSKGLAQIYLTDLQTGITGLISHTPAGRPGNAGSARPVVSGDGSIVVYQSLASNLLCDGKCGAVGSDINLLWDIYVYDRKARRTTRASGDPGDEWMESSRGPSLDETGRVLAFGSTHPVSAQDEGHDEDLFVVDLSRR